MSDCTLRSLVLVSYGYPCNADPSWYPFVQRLAHAVARTGVKTRVLAPLPFHLAWRSRDAVSSIEKTKDGDVVQIRRPRYVSLSDRHIGKWNTAMVGREGFYRAARKAMVSAGCGRPAAFYGHFLYFGGEAAVRLGQEFKVPSFPMVGEGLLNTMDAFGKKRGRKHFAAATALMANSSCLARLVERDLGVCRERIGIFPNGLDHQLFFPRDRQLMRREHGLPDELFLVACAAKQDWLKGPIRVGQAIDGLSGVGGVFLGSGTHPPKSPNIVFNQPVTPEGVPELLSAADIFVLPTAWEGCCNAILEAMACGLPIISSEGEFNDDILNPQVAVRVDPMNVGAIRQAIVSLRDDSARRCSMGLAARQWSQRFEIGRRTRAVLDFMAQWRTRWERDGLPRATTL